MRLRSNGLVNACLFVFAKLTILVVVFALFFLDTEPSHSSADPTLGSEMPLSLDTLLRDEQGFCNQQSEYDGRCGDHNKPSQGQFFNDWALTLYFR